MDGVAQEREGFTGHRVASWDDGWSAAWGYGWSAAKASPGVATGVTAGVPLGMTAGVPPKISPGVATSEVECVLGPLYADPLLVS